MKKIIVLIVVLLFLISCTNEEKEDLENYSSFKFDKHTFVKCFITSSPIKWP